MIGPIVNSLGVFTGSLIGAALGRFLPRQLKEDLPMVFGIVAMGIGIPMIVKVGNFPAVVLALIVGTVVGELLNLEDAVGRLSGRLRASVGRFIPASESDIDQEEFRERFVAMLVLFCLSGAAILGAIQEGFTGDTSILIVKAIMDFVTAIIFAASLGYSLALVALPQFAIQAGLFLLASTLIPLTTESMLADFSALGGLIMLATGFRITRILPIPLTNMLPGMLFVFPVSALWTRLGF